MFKQCYVSLLSFYSYIYHTCHKSFTKLTYVIYHFSFFLIIHCQRRHGTFNKLIGLHNEHILKICWLNWMSIKGEWPWDEWSEMWWEGKAEIKIVRRRKYSFLSFPPEMSITHCAYMLERFISYRLYTIHLIKWRLRYHTWSRDNGYTVNYYRRLRYGRRWRWVARDSRT